MKRHFAGLSSLIVIFAFTILAVPVFGELQTGGSAGEGNPPQGAITLKWKLGPIHLLLEAAAYGGGGDPNRGGANHVLKVNMILQNGKISFIAENGSLLGIVGDKDRLALNIGTQVIGLYDVNNRRIANFDAGGNIHSIVGDCGRLSFIRANGNEIGYIGENGIIIIF